METLERVQTEQDGPLALAWLAQRGGAGAEISLWSV
jgi:hypothetical protein